jgi:hypothetical protein
VRNATKLARSNASRLLKTYRAQGEIAQLVRVRPASIAPDQSYLVKLNALYVHDTKRLPVCLDKLVLAHGLAWCAEKGHGKRVGWEEGRKIVDRLRAATKAHVALVRMKRSDLEFVATPNDVQIRLPSPPLSHSSSPPLPLRAPLRGPILSP